MTVSAPASNQNRVSGCRPVFIMSRRLSLDSQSTVFCGPCDLLHSDWSQPWQTESFHSHSVQMKWGELRWTEMVDMKARSEVCQNRDEVCVVTLSHQLLPSLWLFFTHHWQSVIQHTCVFSNINNLTHNLCLFRNTLTNLFWYCIFSNSWLWFTQNMLAYILDNELSVYSGSMVGLNEKAYNMYSWWHRKLDSWPLQINNRLYSTLAPNFANCSVIFRTLSSSG